MCELSEPKRKAKYAPPSFALAMFIVDFAGVVRFPGLMRTLEWRTPEPAGRPVGHSLGHSFFFGILSGALPGHFGPGSSSQRLDAKNCKFESQQFEIAERQQNRNQNRL